MSETSNTWHTPTAGFQYQTDSVVVTTAQIPGRPAPLLVTGEMIASMRPGSVIVDMAALRISIDEHQYIA